MKKLNDLRGQRAKLHDRNAELLKLIEVAVEERAGKVTDEQIDAEYKDNETKIAALDTEIATLVGWEKRKITNDAALQNNNESVGLPVPVTGGQQRGDAGRNGGTRVESLGENLPAGIRLARMVRALAACRNDLPAAARYAGDVFGDPVVRAAMEAGSFGSGGFIIPEHYVAELIGLLRPVSVVMSMGVTEAPLVNGNLVLPKITGGATAAYVGESTNATSSGLTGGQVKAVAKKCVSLVPFSNDLVRYASPAADLMIRNDMVRAIAQTRDLAYIRDDGAGNAPRGLRYWASSGNIETMTATPDLQKTDNDLGGLIRNLLAGNVYSIPRATGTPSSENVNVGSLGWLLSPRSWYYLSTLRNSNGFKAFPEIEDGMLKGFPFAVTSQIPENLGGGTETEIYFAAFSDVIVAQDPRIETEVSNVAAYHDGSAVVAAFSQDQSVIRTIVNDDLIVRHAEAVSVLTGVTWGA